MSRVMALDYGSKRVGVALSDPTGNLASALPPLPTTPFTKLFGTLRALVREKEVDLILVGLPRNMDGSYGPSARSAEEFARRLKEVVPIPIRMVDERLSTVEAAKKLREGGTRSRQQKEKIDGASAQVMLQSFLDTPKE
ncbi:MAG: Holliday junction resolvase RuvX [Candidatus Methylacidiphilales bacterium]|nr:Holliday junction resolvase RuvX [Candidatus Methylacidiphilales bacterium]